MRQRGFVRSLRSRLVILIQGIHLSVSASLRCSRGALLSIRPALMYCAAPRRCLEHRRSLLWPAIASAVVGLLYLFYVFAVPQLLRFDFRLGLSWYDLGAHGFGPSRGYVSFEDESPVLEIVQPEGSAGCDSRYTFLAPRGDSVPQSGPMILDAQGELVWMKHNWETTQDFSVQQYRGEDFLTYWEGNQIEGRGYGTWYMVSCRSFPDLEQAFPDAEQALTDYLQLDSTYTSRYVINPVGNYGADLHEFHISADDTALVTIYDPTLADLTSVGGPEIGWIYDGLFQEIDIATGDLIFEWRASEHLDINNTYHPLAAPAGNRRDSAFDYFHINSVDKDTDGNYLISARHFHTVICVSKDTGEILWTLGGKANDFQDLSDGKATSFAWQHDARWHSELNSMTIFDNSAHSGEDPESASRGMVVSLDIPNRQATLRAEYYHPLHIQTVSQGNVQLLNGTDRVLVAWGHSAAYSEFSADGQLECNVHFGASAYFGFGRVVSYRVLKGEWTGNPQTEPDAVVSGDMVYVSWNGATEVAAWRLETLDLTLNNTITGELDLDGDAVALGEFAKTGFETEIPLPSDFDSPIFRLAALDAEGNVLEVTVPLQRDSDESSADEVLDLHYLIIGIAIVAGTCGLVAAVYRMWPSCRGRRHAPWRQSEYHLIPVRERERNEADRDPR